MGTPVRNTIQAGGTLGVVVALYGFPFVLTLWLGLFSTGVPSLSDVRGAPERPPVHWMPAPAVALADAGVEEPADEIAPADEVDEPAPPEQADEEAPAELAGAKSPKQRVKRDRKKLLRARAKRRALARAKAKARAKAGAKGRKVAKVPLTKKEQRKKDKRLKRREKRAERKQCGELYEQIVMVSDTEVLLGREIVNCFRTHLEQFDALGGAAWAEEDGKRVGIRIRPSRRSKVPTMAGLKRGDIIKSINGFKMKSWTGVGLAATQIVRGKAKVKLIREGELTVMRFDVVSLEKLEEARRELATVADADEGAP